MKYILFIILCLLLPTIAFAQERGGRDSYIKQSTRFLTAKERVRPGLPEWFLKVMDDDGQVTMANAFVAWNIEDLLARFKIYDTNKDGVITQQEAANPHKPVEINVTHPNWY